MTKADPTDIRAMLHAALDGIAASAGALREAAAMVYDGRSVADARAIAAEAQALRVAILPREKVLDIAAIVAAQFDLTPAAILGASREREIVVARHITMHIAHRHGVTMADIGRALGMDHSSVMHGIRRIKGEIDRKEGETA